MSADKQIHVKKTVGRLITNLRSPISSPALCGSTRQFINHPRKVYTFSRSFLHPWKVSVFFAVVGSFSKPQRWGHRERNQTRKVYWAEKWFCTCVLNLGTFLNHHLQNNNVKWPSSVYLGQPEPQWTIFHTSFWNSTLSKLIQSYPA